MQKQMWYRALLELNQIYFSMYPWILDYSKHWYSSLMLFISTFKIAALYTQLRKIPSLKTADQETKQI